MEQEAAGKIIDGYIVEMNSEPETEKIETKFVAQISLENETWELFYPFVQEERKRCFHSGNMRKKTGLKMPKSGCRRAQTFDC